MDVYGFGRIWIKHIVKQASSVIVFVSKFMYFKTICRIVRLYSKCIYSPLAPRLCENQKIIAITLHFGMIKLPK